MAACSSDGVYHCLADVVIPNKRGLHARASAKFVKCAEQFDAEIFVSKDGDKVGGASLLGLMMLQAHQHSTITIETEGPQAEEAMEALVSLIEAGFHEDE